LTRLNWLRLSSVVHSCEQANENSGSISPGSFRRSEFQTALSYSEYIIPNNVLTPMTSF